MKKKIVGLSLAFTFVMGVVATGISIAKTSGPVKAAQGDRDTTLYLNAGDWDKDGAKFAIWGFGGGIADSWSSFMTPVSGVDHMYVASIANVRTQCIFVRLDKEASGPDWAKKWNQTADLTIPTDGKNCWNITGWGESDGYWSEYPVPTYSVSLDGETKQALSQNPDNMDEYCLTDITDFGKMKLKFYKNDVEINPSIKPNSGLNFNNLWFNEENEMCLWDNPIPTRGKYSIYLNVKENNVWVTGRTSPGFGYFGVGGWENVYVYSCGGYEDGKDEYAYGAWPGIQIYPVSGVCFENHEGTGYGLYRFQLPVNDVGKNNDKFIFNNGEPDPNKVQTAGLTIIDNAYYGAHYTETGDTKRYQAALLIDLFVMKFNGEENKYGDLTNSVCGVDPTLFAEEIETYNNFDSDIKGFVDNATFWTYKDAKNPDEGYNWSFGDIFAQIEVIAGTAGSGAKFYTSLNSDTTFMVSVITVSVIAIAGLAILYIKKRKAIKE